MFKQNNIKLFLATLVAVTGVHNINLALANNTNSSQKIISRNLENSRGNLNLIFTTNTELIAKKSGGRSGGGSFKSKPSRSSSPKRNSSPSSSSNKRKSTSPSRSKYNQRKSTSPTYRNSTPVPVYQDRERNSSTYQRSNQNYNASSHNNRWTWGDTIALSVILLIVGGLIFIFFFIVFKTFFAIFNPKDRANKKIIKERDNDRVTVSMLQVALSYQAESVQQDLSELSLTVDTDSDEGLVELLRESALVLLRNNHTWTHVLSSSNSLDINQAEEAFNKLSFAERSKFSSETLSNVDGKVKTRQSSDSNSDEFSAYVVVTLILGTADDNPLFTRINTEENLQEVLLKLSSMREDYLMKFELLWTPQTANEYLTDEELLMEYTKMISLA